MNWDALSGLPIYVHIHLWTAVLALFIGTWQLLAPKGTPFHKQLGYLWFGLMITTAIAAIFIRSFEGTAMPTLFGFSPIHLFVVLTLWSVPTAWLAIRRGNVKAHANAVRGLYIGGLIIAGALTFLPGRTMWNLFFG